MLFAIIRSAGDFVVLRMNVSCLLLYCHFLIAVQVRFFERVKLERRIRQIEGKAHRGHVLSSEEQQELKRYSHNLQVSKVTAFVR